VILSTGTVLQIPVRELKRGGAAALVTLETAERDAIVRALRDRAARWGPPERRQAGMKRTTCRRR